MMERRKKIALELSDLVIYCRPVPFDEESKNHTEKLCKCLYTTNITTTPLSLLSVSRRDRHRASLFQGYVVFPRNQGREVCQ